MGLVLLIQLLAAPATDPMVTLERTACYGTCPSYAVFVWPDGRLIYDGREYVRTKGRHETRLMPVEVAELRKALLDSGFLDWGEGFDCYEATDNPTATLTFRDGQKHHTIRHYYGCRSKAGLDALTKLEARVDELIHIEHFIGTREERKALRPGSYPRMTRVGDQTCYEFLEKGEVVTRCPPDAGE